jgi:hypothetical protein
VQRARDGRGAAAVRPGMAGLVGEHGGEWKTAAAASVISGVGGGVAEASTGSTAYWVNLGCPNQLGL